MTTIDFVIPQPKVAPVRAIKSGSGYRVRMTVRAQVQAMWLSGCVVAGTIAQAVANLSA